MMFRALKGIEIAGTAYHPGDVIAADEMPPAVREWLLERNAIAETDEAPKPAPKKKKGS